MCLKKAVGKLNLASGSVYSFYEIAKKSIELTNSKIKIKTTKKKKVLCRITVIDHLIYHF